MTITRDGVAGTPTVNSAVSTTTRSLGTVTTGRTIIVALSVLSLDGPHTYSSSSLTKSAGDAEISTPVLDEVVGGNNGDDGYTYAALWRFKVTSGGTLTIQIAHRSNSYPSVDHESLQSDDPIEYEDGNGAHSATNGLSAHASGNATSAGAAAFFGVLACNNGASQTFTPQNSFTQIGTESGSGGAFEGLSFTYRAVSSGTTTEASWTFTTMDGNAYNGVAATVVAYQEAAPTTALEQEGFRFGRDDGAENAHAWEAAQDANITAPAGQTRVLNMLVNVTGDPGAKTFKLQFRKVGDPGWTDVPIQ